MNSRYPGYPVYTAAIFVSGVIFIILSVVLLSVSAIPFGDAKQYLDSLSLDGNVDFIDPAKYGLAVMIFRIAAVFMALSGMIFCTAKKRVAQMLAVFAVSLRDFNRDIINYIGSAARGDGIYFYAMLVFTAIAFAIRLMFINIPITYDESSTFVNYAQYPLYKALSYYDAPNNHLLNTMLIRLCYDIFGNQLWALRLPAFFSGVMLIPVCYLFGRGFFNKQTGLLASGLAAVSGYLINYSVMARGYMIICLIFLIFSSLAVYLEKKENTFGYFLFSIIPALGFYTIPVMLFAYGGPIFWLLAVFLGKGKYRSAANVMKTVVFTGLFVLLMYTPVFLVAGPGAVFDNTFVESKSWSFFVKELPVSLISTYRIWTVDIPVVFQVMLVSGFIVSFFVPGRHKNQGILFILTEMMWIAALLLVKRVVPFERVWLFLLPLAFVYTSFGISYIFGIVNGRIRADLFPFFAIVLTAYLSGIMALNFSISPYEKSPLPDGEAISVYLKDRLEQGDFIITTDYAITSLEYYFLKYGIPHAYLKENMDKSRRLYLVLQDRLLKDIKKILHVYGVSGPGYKPPVLVEQFRSSCLYVICRNGPA